MAESEILNIYQDIPCYNNGKWGTVSYPSREAFANDLETNYFKEPGEYQLDKTVLIWQAQAHYFREKGYYCPHPDGSREFINYWDDQKLKSRKGCFFIVGKKKWYLPRDYYFWINFLKIVDKVKKIDDFTDIWDSQLHLSLYNFIAELKYRHAAVLKKRQFGSSLYHAAKLINLLWFEQSPVLKIGASLSAYITGVNGTWKILQSYRIFLNEHTAWYRPMNPGGVGEWQQKIEYIDQGRKTERGLKGVLQSLSFEQSDTAGVGGLCHSLGTKILMSSGQFKNVEDIQVGEYVIGIDNKPKRVNRLFSGVSEILQVNQKRGHSYNVTPEHTLYLKTRDVHVKDNCRNMQAKEWSNLSQHQKNVTVGFKNKLALNFDPIDKPTLDPYFLGLWLGDGYRNVVGFIVNQDADPEILNYIAAYCDSVGAKYSFRPKDIERYNCKMITAYVHVKDNNNQDNYILKQFVKYNLFYNKHIPVEYKTGSIETRTELLAGIIDTDGYYCSEKGHFEISSKYESFANDIAFICRSLGAYVRINKKKSKEHGKIIETETYCVSARFLDSSIIPTKIKRKIGNHLRIKSIHSSPIKSIESLGVQQYAGIEVEDHLYFLEDLTITHNCTLFFYEEAGITKSMDKTYEFMRPAMESGDITTGQFICAGSVGDLKQCEPLKQFMYTPEGNGFYGVKNKWINDRHITLTTGLFIPEQWSMPPYIDKFGNSDVEGALASILEKRIQWKKDLAPERYQIRVSQHPTNLEEAFAFRGESVFNTQLLSHQKRKIEEGDYPFKSYKLKYGADGEVIATPTMKLPINIFPVPKTLQDKTGVLQVWEEPIEDKVFCQTYYASIDPVAVGKSSTSESLCSIFIYKTAAQVTRRYKNGDTETIIDGDKIVASWCGRHDDLDQTHEMLCMIIEWYQAWTLVEVNVSLFIQYMQFHRKHKYLVPSSQMVFTKDAIQTSNQHHSYGWRNISTVFKNSVLPHLIAYLSEVLDEEFDDEGNSIAKLHGISRIPDKMAIVEMEQYQPGVNVDRIVSLAALIAFVKIQEANRGLVGRIENEDTEHLHNSDKMYKLKSSPFKNIGKSRQSSARPNRSPFKNIR